MSAFDWGKYGECPGAFDYHPGVKRCMQDRAAMIAEGKRLAEELKNANGMMACVMDDNARLRRAALEAKP